jgi:hypothetical protein
MNIVELVLAVCLSAQPAVCDEQHFQFFAEGGTFGCLVRAQPYIADWQTQHPEWTVKRWKCVVPRADKDA